MWNLEYELIAILMLAAMIGLLMGRFLCKSGETEERLKKEKVIAAFKSAKLDLEASEARSYEQASVVTHQKESIRDFEENNSNLTMRLNTSEVQRQKLLEELKELEKYKSRFEALEQEFGVQSEQMNRLKEQKGTQIEAIEAQKTQINVLNHTIEELENKQKEREGELDTALDMNRKQGQKIKELYQLNENSMAAINDMSDQREALSDQLEAAQGENKRLEALLHEKEEDFTLLEKEFGTYKSSFSMDHERLQFLEKEYEVLGKNFNTVLMERDDLMSRIRAISSVVGAVGIDEEA